MAGIIARQYQDEDAAREHLQKIRWPEGPECPHCGLINEAYQLKPKEGSKRPVRKGVWKCKGCRKQFTVTVNTIFSDSHIPLHKWLLAIHLMCSSKKGISAHQLWRNLWGVNEKTGRPNGSYRTAWFMAHRIRWALGQEPMATKLKGVVEIDETFIGGRRRYGPRWKDGKHLAAGVDNRQHRAPVVAVLERDGNVRSFHVDRVTSENLKPIVDEMIDENTHVMTDSATVLKFPGKHRKHDVVNHSRKEYARREGDLVITTNTVEGYFSILKRGINGVFHHVGRQHLDQYLREFDFRYNVRRVNDCERTKLAIEATSGKRLMLKTPRANSQLKDGLNIIVD